jgi:hypothetical protein
VKRNGDERSLFDRNGFSAFIFFPERDGNTPGGSDSLLPNIKPSDWGEIFSNPYSNGKCLNHRYLLKKQIKPHLRNVDQYPIPFPFGQNPESCKKIENFFIMNKINNGIEELSIK